MRSEVKNIGSVRGVASAVRFEIQRQIDLLESGGTVLNETRSWDVENKRTVAMRDKETLQVRICRLEFTNLVSLKPEINNYYLTIQNFTYFSQVFI